MEDQNIEPNDNQNDGEQLKIELNPDRSTIGIREAQFFQSLEEFQLECKELHDTKKVIVSHFRQEIEKLSGFIDDSSIIQMCIVVKNHSELIRMLKERVLNFQKRLHSFTKTVTVFQMAKQREALQREHIKESMLVKEQELISKQT